MASALTTITNVSKQVVPILINNITTADANSNSTVPADKAQQMLIAPSAQVTIETRRLDLGQLEQLRRKKLLSFSAS